MFGSNKARSDKQAESCVSMMRCPHDIFRHILSFKDPTRQVGVKGGIKTDSASAMPPYFEPLSGGYAPADIVMTRRAVITSRGLRWFLYIWDTDEMFEDPNDVDWLRNPWRDAMVQEFEMSSNPIERPPSELWLRCEGCGPDLELYDLLR